jgi:hypothetical protein
MIINNSFVVKSIGKYFVLDAIIPNVTLNQHLEKPIKPNTLQININKKQESGETSKRPTKI